MLDDKRLISNVVSLLKRTTSEHGIYIQQYATVKSKHHI